MGASIARDALKVASVEKGIKPKQIKPTPPRPPKPPTPPEKIVRVEGFDVHINPAGTYIVVEKDGKSSMVTIEEYREMFAEKLVGEAKTFDDLRRHWLNPADRENLIRSLPNDGQGARLLQDLLRLKDCDLYDVFAEVGFGIAPKTRKERVEALRYKHDAWFKGLPENATSTLLALAMQFERGGTEELENPHVFNSPELAKAGGLKALKVLGEPKDIINQTKERLFAA